MKIQRITQSDLLRLIENTVNRVQEERVNMFREIVLAQKELMTMGKHLSSLGLRLDGTKYRPLFDKLRDAMVQLNNELITAVKGGGK